VQEEDMSKTTIVTAALFLAGTSLVLSQRIDSGRPDSPEVLLKRAIALELTDGQPKAAAARYRDIATRFKGTDRRIAAQALLHEARSYEKIGSPESRRVYAELLKDFADQPAAMTARARTGAAVPTQSALAFTKEHVFDGVFPADMTGDERVIVGVTFGKPGVFLRDVFGNTTATVLQMQENGWLRNAILSPNGRSIAFEWEVYGARSSSLFVVDAAPRARPRALLTQPKGSAASPIGWSPDGRAILVQLNIGPGFWQGDKALAWVSVADGSRRIVKTFEPWQRPFLRRAVSPNGEHIAYSAVASQGSRDRYVYICDANGKNESVVVRLAGANDRPVWTPDSAGLAFLNTRTGPSDLMFVSIPAPGASSAAEPVAIRRAFASGTELMKISNSGELLYVQSEDTSNQEVVVDRNPAGRVGLAFTGQSGVWSPDGRRIAFYKPAAAPGLGNELVVRDLDTGAERVYARAGLTLVSPRWFGDSRRLIVRVNAVADGQAAGSGGAFYAFDTAAGTFSRLLGRNSDDRERTGGVLSPDDKTLYLLARARTANALWTEVVAVDVATGTSQLAFALPGKGLPGDSAGMALSPDGTTLALRAWTDDSESDSRLLTVRVDGTDHRDLFGPIKGFAVADQMRWAPDGQSILFTAFGFTGPHPEGGWRLMRISPNGGTPEPDGLDSTKLFGTGALLKLDVNNVSNMDLSPDGSQVLFSSRRQIAYVVWKAKNFLAQAVR
jgi:Tol biopolymer transport system component